MISTNITVIIVILIFIFFIILLLKFNVVDVEQIKRKNVKVKSGNKSYKVYISEEDNIPVVSKKYRKPDILYCTNIYPRNPDKLINVFAGTFMAASATMALVGKTPSEIIVSATISSLVAGLFLLR